MAPHDLTVSELADLIAPANHPQRLSADELEALTSHISEAQLDDVIRRLGVGIFVRQLPPTFHRVLSAVRRVARDPSPAYIEDIDDLVHDFDEQSLGTSSCGIISNQLNVYIHQKHPLHLPLPLSLL